MIDIQAQKESELLHVWADDVDMKCRSVKFHLVTKIIYDHMKRDISISSAQQKI